MAETTKVNESAPAASVPASDAGQGASNEKATRPEDEAGSTHGSGDNLVQGGAATEKLTFWQKVKRHFRKYWKWHLLAAIILAAILLPILFKVIIPAIVQSVVNGQELPVASGYFQGLSSEKVLVSLNTALYSPLSVEKDAGPLYLYNADTPDYSPFFSLELGQQGINKWTPAIITNDTATITNETELVKWLGRIYSEETVDLSIRAWPLIHVGVIPTYNYLDKTIQLPGLNGFSGASVKDLQLFLPPPENGPSIKGTIVLPNHGIIALNLGNLTLDLYSGDLVLGQVTVNDTLLNPGNNTKDFQGQLFLDKLSSNLGTLLASQAGPLGRGVIELNATATSAMANGSHIDFLETLLANRKITLDISVVTFLSDVVSALLNGGNKSLVDVLGDVLGNKTFVSQVMDNFNSTRVDANGTSVASKIKARRSSNQGSMAWNMLKLGMKMKLKGKLF